MAARREHMAQKPLSKLSDRPVMVAMMLIATNKSVMRAFRLGPIVAIAGWASTALMAIAALVLIWSWLA